MPNPSQTLQKPQQILDWIVLFIATGGYSGYARIVPATVGSFVGLLLFLPMTASPFLAQLAFTGGFLCLGIWVAGRAEETLKIIDPRPIVIDEIVGMWISLLLLPNRISYFLAAFILFRLFDVIKPFPAKQAEHLRGGWGIVLDDVVAGLYTNVLLQGIQTFNYF